MKINSLNDLERIIGDQPIETRFYIEGYESIVARAVLELYRDNGFRWGDEEPTVSNSAFWDCFKCAEIN